MVVFNLLDDEGVIHIPELYHWRGWVGGSVYGLDFKLFHEQVGHSGTS